MGLCDISQKLTWLRVEEEKDSGFSEGLDLGQKEEVQQPTASPGKKLFIGVTFTLAAWRRLAALHSASLDTT